jgi:hypothetical protein
MPFNDDADEFETQVQKGGYTTKRPAANTVIVLSGNEQWVVEIAEDIGAERVDGSNDQLTAVF